MISDSPVDPIVEPTPAVTDLPIGQHTYEFLCGTAGCLAGTTTVVYLRGIRNGGRPLPLADLYKKFNGFLTRNPWQDASLPTFLHSVADDGVMFYNKVVAVLESGIQPTVRVTLRDQSILTATPSHPILTPNGFVHAGDLLEGTPIICRGSMFAQSQGGRDLSARPPRILVNVKYHPYGAYKCVEGRYEYTCVARARLMVEAALNNLPYADFVHALKHNLDLAARFRYVPPEFEVHHDDEDTLNDDLSNLIVLSKAEHARLHNQKGNFHFDSTQEIAVASVETADECMTYDVQMTTPANNFCANGMVVHNTGKTWTAKALADRDHGVELAATTGIAAVNLGEGTTINALLRYFDTASLRDSYTHGTLQSVLRKLRRTGLRRIVLDEVSMLSGQQLTLLARAVEEVNTQEAAKGIGELDADDEAAWERRAERQVADQIGPLGLTLVGDFGQLPPVPDEDETTGKKIPVQFAFESPEWPRFAEHVTKLDHIWRQDAQDFIQALHAVRRADVATALQFFTPNRFSVSTDDHFEGSTVFAKNDAVDRYNQLRMDELTGPAIEFATVRKGKQRGDWKLIPEILRVKEGALVMLLSNRREYEDEDDSRGTIIYANGDLATLRGPAQNTGGWYVTLHRTQQQVVVYPITRQYTIPLEPGRRKVIKAEIVASMGGTDEHSVDVFELRTRLAARITESGREIVGTVFYMPMRAAYGCTVHKTQGLTLDRVQVNIRDPFFRHPGMLFVALSRCRTAEGLRIVGDQRGFVERCKIEPRVRPWL